jgi:putative endonuclease
MNYHNYFVYIVQCTSDLYYTGITNSLGKRITQDNEGKDVFSFTYKRRIVTLTYYERFTDVKQAIAREKQLKGPKKEALFNEDYDLLKKLAKSKNR